MKTSPQIFSIIALLMGLFLMVNGCNVNRRAAAYAEDKIKVIKSMVDTSHITIREVFTVDTIIRADTLVMDTIIRAGRTVIENRRQMIVVNYDPDAKTINLSSFIKEVPVTGTVDRTTERRNKIHNTESSQPWDHLINPLAGIAVVLIAISMAILAGLALIKAVKIQR